MTKLNGLTGKTVKIDTTIGAWKAYVDDELVAQHNSTGQNYTRLQLGSSTMAMYKITVSAVRVYRPTSA